jgi:hypothetical protein
MWNVNIQVAGGKGNVGVGVIGVVVNNACDFNYASFKFS